MAQKPIVLFDDRYAPGSGATAPSGSGGGAGTIQLKDEGNSLGAVSSLNVIGSGISASASLGAGTVTLAASATPAASTIPFSDTGGKLASGWGGSASSLASLDAFALVPAAQEGSGTADNKRVLYGNRAWDFPEIRRLVLETNVTTV